MRIEDRIVRTERVLTYLIQWLNIQLGQAAVDELIAALSDDEVYMPRPPIVRPQDDRQDAAVQHKETMMLDPMPRKDVTLPPTPREAQLMADLAEARAQVAALRDAANQSRLAFAGYVSARSAIDKLDEALSATADAAKRHDAEVRRKALEEATVMVAAALERAADEIQPDGERPEEAAMWAPLPAYTAYRIGCYDAKKSDAAAVRSWITPDVRAALNAHDAEVRKSTLEEAAQVADQQINLGEAVKVIRALIDKEPGHE